MHLSNITNHSTTSIINTLSIIITILTLHSMGIRTLWQRVRMVPLALALVLGSPLILGFVDVRRLKLDLVRSSSTIMNTTMTMSTNTKSNVNVSVSRKNRPLPPRQIAIRALH